ncbi:MAG: phage major capsid protein [Frankiaceae bacterium]
MSPLEIMEARLAELRKESEALYAQRGAVIDKAAAEKRGMTDEEQASFDAAGTKRAAIEKELPLVAERVTELREEAKRESAAAAARAEGGQTEHRAPATVQDPPVYARDRHDTSYFLDLYRAQQKGDSDSYDRLRRNAAQAAESRALGNTNAAGGSGGEFAPPLWMVSDYVALARPGRIGVDLFDIQPLPAGVSSVNVPKVATGTTVAVQTTQNTALSQTDMTTTSLSSGIVTVGGKQIVSLQLLEQSPIPFDRVILEDLALAYAGSIDVQGLSGTGTSGQLRGLASAAGLTTQTYTQATPSVAGAGGFYSNVAQAISKVYASRYLAPDSILMHPRRWAWITAAFDTQNRPLVVPSAYAVNVVATDDVNNAMGLVGQLQGLNVYVDPNIPTNTGAGTNQDPAYIFRRGDIKMWESAPRMETFEQPYADSMGVLFRMYAYAALVPDRYGSSIVVVNGTGMVTPTF